MTVIELLDAAIEKCTGETGQYPDVLRISRAQWFALRREIEDASNVRLPAALNGGEMTYRGVRVVAKPIALLPKITFGPEELDGHFGGGVGPMGFGDG